MLSCYERCESSYESAFLDLSRHLGMRLHVKLQLRKSKLEAGDVKLECWNESFIVEPTRCQISVKESSFMRYDVVMMRLEDIAMSMLRYALAEARKMKENEKHD